MAGCAFAALTVQTLSAQAQGLLPAQAPGLGNACVGDYLRYCRGVPPGGGRIILCLNLYADQLSQACFQALAQRGLEFAAALKACRADAERICPGVPPGWGRGLACLLDNTSRLSVPCRDALARHDLLDEPAEPPPRPPR
jgi:hypothetical protein